MTCAEIRMSLGAYVLGTLPSHEMETVRFHLSKCPPCDVEHRELSGLPDLLALVSGAEVGMNPRLGRHAAAAQPDATPLLERLLASAVSDAGARRRRSRLQAALAAAAAVVVVLAGVALFTPDRDAPAPGLAGGVKISAIDSASGTRGQLTVARRGWGTALSISLQGVQPGLTCRLEAVGTDGSREVASTWWVPTEGYSAATGSLTIPGAVAMPTSKIDRYEVITSDGERLLTIAGE